MPLRPHQPAGKGRRARLRDRLKARAYATLALLSRPLAASLTVRATDAMHLVTISVTPAGDAAAGAVAVVGLFFSPIEQLIVDRVRGERTRSPDKPLAGKRIAGLIGQPYDATFKAVVRNLVDRQVLTHSDGEGYDVAAAPKRAA